ncbi:alpha/beta fold hydrolase [Rhodococcus rhodnii]|uniref:Hydrolase n=2 Tax=Rhodococcus rhodnii TaxID=38312 RepID=R7WH87_9NOCA|nr:alpha/beta fold hydrolase [Rhodococcus rhodnii]EOM74468.1 hydrolase [Rhodococcus rhodnii LMG 5362]TXG89163.1 alpha/beta fold hydrolase [Rhodococcus rhodnii]
MPISTINGISLNHQESGTGDLVVLVMGTGSPGRVWDLHQTPALTAAGYRVCTFDNRGIAPSDEGAGGITIEDMVADTAALIEHLGGGRAHVVGTSMGARVAQELALAWPDLVAKVVLLASHARMDRFQLVLSEGERQLADSGVALPPKYQAAVTAALNLSPASLRDDRAAQDWLDLFEFGGGKTSPGVRAQLEMDRTYDRREAYRGITAPCLSVGFADDRMIPPYLAREVADAVPGGRYVEVPDAGHYGYLERPEVVNRIILDFLRE